MEVLLAINLTPTGFTHGGPPPSAKASNSNHSSCKNERSFTIWASTSKTFLFLSSFSTNSTYIDILFPDILMSANLSSSYFSNFDSTSFK